MGVDAGRLAGCPPDPRCPRAALLLQMAAAVAPVQTRSVKVSTPAGVANSSARAPPCSASDRAAAQMRGDRAAPAAAGAAGRRLGRVGA